MSADTLRYILVVFALIFLFDGDPDVWDKLHDKALQVQCN